MIIGVLVSDVIYPLYTVTMSILYLHQHLNKAIKVECMVIFYLDFATQECKFLDLSLDFKIFQFDTSEN